jgi:glycerate-2-kinase
MKRMIALAVLLAPVAALAGPEQQVAITGGCRSSTNWSEAACVCIAEKAMSLNEAQQSFLAASLNGQDSSAHAAGMTVPQTLEASMFMMKQGPACQ